MFKRFLLLSLIIAFVVSAANAQSIVVKVREADGSPSIPAVTEIVVPNNSLTKSGSKATFTFGVGDTVGAASSTDNAIVRFDGTTGKTIQNSLVTMGDNGAITLPMTSASGVREVLLNLSVSDSGNARWQLANATSTNSSFIPSMVGYFDTNATSASMDFRGLVSAANDASDSATPGIIEFTTARTDSTSDPANGTLSAIVNRKLWTVNNTGTRVILLTAAGHLYLGSGGAFGFASAANATGTIDTRWVRHAAGTLRASDATTGGGTLLVAPSTASLTGSFTVLPDNAATNALVDVARVGVNSTGTAAAGLGPRLSFSAESSTTNDQQIAAIAALWTDATHATRSGDLSFATTASGTSGERLRITSDGRVYGTALHNNAGAVTGTTNQYVASGTYTPSLTNVTNVAASTAYACQWIRVGNVVTVSGKFDLDATATVATELGISLPIASNLAAEENLGGNATTSVAASAPGRINGDSTNDRAQVRMTVTTISNDSYAFSFTYVIL